MQPNTIRGDLGRGDLAQRAVLPPAISLPSGVASMANDLERARVDISRYEDRCAKVEKELLEPLTEERRQKLESQLNLLLANLVELRKKENLAQEAQDRSE